MRRTALMLAIAGLGSGCYSSSRTYANLGDVAVYWDFARNLPAGGRVTYTCAEAGVDYVTVTFPGGALVDPANPTLSCTLRDQNGNSVQGTGFVSFPPGSTTFVVTGYRKVGAVPNLSIDAALFQGQQTINVVVGQPSGQCGGANTACVSAPGLQANLTVTAVLTQGGVTYLTCGSANIQRFDYFLRDGTQRVVDQGGVPCGPSDTPGVSFGPIDLDDYTLSLDAIEAGATPAQDLVIWSVCRQPLQHFANDNFALTLPLGVCPSP
jgi:hypothetical protein